MYVKDHWGTIVQDLLEFRYIDMAENPEFTAIRNASNTLTKDLLIKTAPENILSRYEKILGIEVDQDINVRRGNILNKLSTRTPFTKRWLVDKLDTLIGKGNYTLAINGLDYEIVIEVDMAFGHIFSSVQSQFRKQIPANMLLTPKLKITAIVGIISLSKTYRFEPPVCEYVTGVYPYSAYLGKIDERSLEVTSEVSRYLFDSELSGTKPYISILGKLDERQLTIDSDISRYLFDSELSGTKPDISMLGKLDERQLTIDSDISRYLFDPEIVGVKLGIKPDISTLGKIAHEEAQALEIRDVIPFSYKLCNTVKCGM